MKSIRQALAQAGASGKQVRAIGLTGQMHGLVLLDTQNRVLRPAILWNDQRTGAECEEITRQIGLRQTATHHRQQSTDRLHCAEDPVGAQA